MLEHNLKQPCNNCPFTREGGPKLGLHRDRVSEIAAAGSFACHKTVSHEEDEDGECFENLDGASWCVGHLLYRKNNPSQLMRIEERLGALDFSKMSGSEKVYADLAQMLEGHGHERQEPTGTGEPCSVAGQGCTAPAGWLGADGVEDNPDADAEHYCYLCDSPVCSACCNEHPKHEDEVLCHNCEEYEDDEDDNEVPYGG